MGDIFSEEERSFIQWDAYNSKVFTDKLMRIGCARIGEHFERNSTRSKAHTIWSQHVPKTVKEEICRILFKRYKDPYSLSEYDRFFSSVQRTTEFVAQSLTSAFPYKFLVGFINNEDIEEFTKLVDSIDFFIEFTSSAKEPFLIMRKIPLKDEIAILHHRQELVMAKIVTNMTRLADILLGEHSMALMRNDHLMFRSNKEVSHCLDITINLARPHVEVTCMITNMIPSPVDVTDVMSDPDRMAAKIRGKVELGILGFPKKSPENEANKTPACRPCGKVPACRP